MTKQDLIDYVVARVYQNTNKEVSGDDNQEALLAIVDKLFESQLISDTYDNIKAMADGGLLSVGWNYEITDFQTCYDQPVTDDYKTGSVEPIILKAATTGTFHAQVISTLYPQDVIYYDINFDTTPVTNSPAKGRITYRRDENGNETDFDFRNILSWNALNSQDYSFFNENFVQANANFQNQWAVRTTPFGAGYYYPNSAFEKEVINISNSNFFNSFFNGDVVRISNCIFANTIAVGNLIRIDTTEFNNSFLLGGCDRIGFSSILDSNFQEKVEHLSNVFIFGCSFDKRLTGINNIELNDTTCNCFIYGLIGNALSSQAIGFDNCTIVGDTSSSFFSNITVNCLLQNLTISETDYPELFNTQIHKTIYNNGAGIFYCYFDNTNTQQFVEITP